MTLSQRAELNALRERYRTDLKPAGAEQDLAVEHIARAAWAIRTLERQEAEICAAHRNPYRDETARKSLLGIAALRSHYGSTYQASIRLFMKLASRDARRRKRSSTTNRESKTP